MAITKIGEKFKLDLRIGAKRVIRLFNTKREAKAYEQELLSGRLKPAKVENRRLNDLITSWYDLHGQSLKSAVDTRDRLYKLSDAMGNPALEQFTVNQFAYYRKQRLKAGINASTLNRELSTLKALFRELKRLNLIAHDHSILSVRKLKEKRIELSYLTAEQINKLMHQVKQSTNDSLEYVVKLSLATGGRWSECERLTLDKLRNGGVYYVDTKNGHSRFVPLSAELFKHLQQRLAEQPFKSCYGAFRSALKRTGINLPDGQQAHVLRHTFASHFIMQGGDIRTLQQILGHSSLQMTMRYAHLAPEFLGQAVQLNPLENQSGKNMERISLS